MSRKDVKRLGRIIYNALVDDAIREWEKANTPEKAKGALLARAQKRWDRNIDIACEISLRAERYLSERGEK